MNSLILTDLDGTFVKNSISVTELDSQKMKKFKHTMYTGVATGRSSKEIAYIEKQTGIKFDVKISFNGAIVEMFGEIISDTPLEDEIKNDIVDYLLENNIKFDALDGESRIGTFSTEDTSRSWNMSFRLPLDVKEELKQTKIYKINIRPTLEYCDEVLLALTKEFKQVEICKSGSERIEITPYKVTKGLAIEKIREREKIKIIAVGDSENDIDMLKHADYSICLSHASDEVKKVADEVINDFHEIDLIKIPML